MALTASTDTVDDEIHLPDDIIRLIVSKLDAASLGIAAIDTQWQPIVYHEQLTRWLHSGSLPRCLDSFVIRILPSSLVLLPAILSRTRALGGAPVLRTFVRKLVIHYAKHHSASLLEILKYATVYEWELATLHYRDLDFYLQAYYAGVSREILFRHGRDFAIELRKMLPVRPSPMARAA